MEDSEHLQTENGELWDDLTLALKVRNEALRQAALDCHPGPDGQDYLDRDRLVLKWIHAAYEELGFDTSDLETEPSVMPRQSLLDAAEDPD